MSQKRKPRGVSATLEGIKLLKGAKASGREDEGKPLTYPRIAERAKVNEKTVQRFFHGERVDLDSALEIIKALGLQEEDVLPLEDSKIAESIERIQAKSTANSERASELIQELETALSELKASKNASLPARDWLKANRAALSREAAKSALEKSYDKKLFDVDEYYSEEIGQFSKEVRKYLQLLYYCLEAGTWEFMDRAMQESLIPMNRDSQLYVEALKFIKNQKVSRDLLPEEARELTLCLDYLINTIPIRF